MNSYEEIKKSIIESYGFYYQKINGTDPKKSAEDVLSEKKPREQLFLLEKHVGELRGRKLLEVGSGYGMLLVVSRRDYGVESFGIEPDSDGFASSFQTSKKILKYYGIEDGIVLNASGDSIPYNDNSFDVVYSTNVLEHCVNPELVIKESVRVLKSGGFLQFVFPNYGSFWEGHYYVFWIPYLNHFLARIYLFVIGKNPEYSNSLQFVNYFTIKKIISRMDDISVIDFGESVFKERMESMAFSDWAGLAIIKKWILMAHKLKIVKLITFLMISFKAHTPIILTIKKNEKKPA